MFGLKKKKKRGKGKGWKGREMAFVCIRGNGREKKKGNDSFSFKSLQL